MRCSRKSLTVRVPALPVTVLSSKPALCHRQRNHSAKSDGLQFGTLPEAQECDQTPHGAGLVRQFALSPWDWTVLVDVIGVNVYGYYQATPGFLNWIRCKSQAKSAAGFSVFAETVRRIVAASSSNFRSRYGNAMVRSLNAVPKNKHREGV